MEKFWWTLDDKVLLDKSEHFFIPHSVESEHLMAK